MWRPACLTPASTYCLRKGRCCSGLYKAKRSSLESSVTASSLQLENLETSQALPVYALSQQLIRILYFACSNGSALVFNSLQVADLKCFPSTSTWIQHRNLDCTVVYWAHHSQPQHIGIGILEDKYTLQSILRVCLILSWSIAHTGICTSRSTAKSLIWSTLLALSSSHTCSERRLMVVASQ